MDSQITVYIDEGGDAGVKDGLRYVNTRYEWLSIGAAVVRSKNDNLAVDWIREIKAACRSHQKPDLHYAELSNDNRIKACSILSKKQMKGLCILSHKTNMREYQNPRMGGGVPEAQFYNWCCRLLIERIMFWADWWYKEQKIPVAPIRFIFSEKGGHDYDHMFNYFCGTLNMQARAGTFVKKPKRWNPDFMHRDYVHVRPHKALAGLQVADVVASCFYQAANSESPKWDLAPAKAIQPIIVKNNQGTSEDLGLTVWPLRHQSEIPEASRAIFSHYGYIF